MDVFIMHWIAQPETILSKILCEVYIWLFDVFDFFVLLMLKKIIHFAVLGGLTNTDSRLKIK